MCPASGSSGIHVFGIPAIQAAEHGNDLDASRSARRRERTGC